MRNLQKPANLRTGGANGIGAATVRLFHSHGAFVIFGDIDTKAGTALANSYSDNVHFVTTDVTSYQAILGLFDEALSRYARIDIAISNAGLTEKPGWFEPRINMDSVRTPPSTATLDVNLTGALYFSRIAAVYLRQNASKDDDKNLILISSVAGFEESPGIFVYQAAKHGVIGLMRSLRLYTPKAYSEAPIRVNCVCPGATKTAMMSALQTAWEQSGLPENEPGDVGEVIVGLAADGEINGESIYVVASKGWAFEEKLTELQSQWLGEESWKHLTAGQEFLGQVSYPVFWS